MAVRNDPVVKGKENVFYVKKPGGNTFVMLGCMTNYTFDEPGYTLEKVACRAGVKQSTSGDKDLATLNIEGINHVYPTGQVASNVSEEEVRGWAQAGTVLEAKWGGTLEGDPVHSGKGIFNQFSESNPNDANSTYSVTFNSTEEYTTAALAAA